MTLLFWTRYLQAISLLFAALGAFWAVAGSFDPFGVWDSAFARAFYNAPTLSSDVARAKEFILAPFGATAAGYFLLQFFIAKHAFPTRERWAYQAVVVSFLFWFLLDSSMSALHGAYFNILFANVPSLFAMLPVFFLRGHFRSRADQPGHSVAESE